jgi:hypothetical protein
VRAAGQALRGLEARDRLRPSTAPSRTALRVFESSAPAAELNYDPAIKFLLRFFASVLASPTAGHAPKSGVRPQPTPTQTPAHGVGRLFREEARLPVFAAGERGRPDSPLEITDVPRTAMSVRRTPDCRAAAAAARRPFAEGAA